MKSLAPFVRIALFTQVHACCCGWLRHSNSETRTMFRQRNFKVGERVTKSPTWLPLAGVCSYCLCAQVYNEYVPRMDLYLRHYIRQGIKPEDIHIVQVCRNA